MKELSCRPKLDWHQSVWLLLASYTHSVGGQTSNGRWPGAARGEPVVLRTVWATSFSLQMKNANSF